MPIAACMNRAPRICAYFALILAAALAGCSTTGDPSFNPYAPPGGDPPLLRRADAVMDGAEGALDNLDRRLENALY